MTGKKKGKWFNKLISIVLTLCLSISMVSVSLVSVSAEEENFFKKTSSVWGMNQIYSRGLSAAGAALMAVANVSDCEEFQEAAGFINKWVFGGSDTSKDIAEIKSLCNEILSEVKKIETQLVDISGKISGQDISDAYNRLNYAWKTQVVDIEDKYGLDEALNEYKTYLKYVSCNITGTKVQINKNEEKVPEQADIDAQRLEVEKALFGVTNTDKLAKEQYLKSTINPDNKMANLESRMYYCIDDLCSALNTTDAVGKTVTRYIDRAAQYAYLAFPYSNQQADFVDAAVLKQSTEISYLVLMYQDFVVQRADYFEELVEASENDEEKEGLNQIYNNNSDNTATVLSELLEDVITDLANWLNSKIYIQNNSESSYLYLSTYLDSQSADKTQLVNSAFDNDLSYEFYQKKENIGAGIADSCFYRCEIKEAFNKSKKNSTPFTAEAMTFNKNAVIVPKSNELASVNTVYLLDAESTKEDNMYMTQFDMKWDVSLNPDIHVPTSDYYNLVRGEYSDGYNTYSCISSPDDLSALINNTTYSANGSEVYTYFYDYLNYSGSNPLYLLLDAKIDSEEKSLTDYSKLPLLNISKGVSANWSNAYMSLYNLQSDRKGADNKTNSMYALILTSDNSTEYSKVSSTVSGSGTASVSITGDAYNSQTGLVASGSKVNLNIDLGENTKINSIKVHYHNDSSNKEKVTKTIDFVSDGNNLLCDDKGLITLDYSVPYSNVTIEVVTEYVSEELKTDKNGNYVIETFDDLCVMSDMVNSNNEKYVKSSYVLTKDIDCTGEEWTTIGTKTIQFNGTFDGQGHTISNLNVNSGAGEGSRQGLFASLGKKAVVKNLTVSNASVFPSESPVVGAGVIAKQNNGTISNCMVTDSSVQLGNWEYLGGVSGLNNGTIENCAVSDTTITRRWSGSSTKTMGGITEVNKGTVKDCYTFYCTFNNGTSSNAPIVASGNAPENCYYYTDSSVNRTYGKMRSIFQFINGEVTYLLNNGKTDGTQVWYQNVDNGGSCDVYPVLTNNGKNTVYKVNLNNRIYSNSQG